MHASKQLKHICPRCKTLQMPSQNRTSKSDAGALTGRSKSLHTTEGTTEGTGIAFAGSAVVILSCVSVPNSPMLLPTIKWLFGVVVSYTVLRSATQC